MLPRRVRQLPGHWTRGASTVLEIYLIRCTEARVTPAHPWKRCAKVSLHCGFYRDPSALLVSSIFSYPGALTQVRSDAQRRPAVNFVTLSFSAPGTSRPRPGIAFFWVAARQDKTLPLRAHPARRPEISTTAPALRVPEAQTEFPAPSRGAHFAKSRGAPNRITGCGNSTAVSRSPRNRGACLCFPHCNPTTLYS